MINRTPIHWRAVLLSCAMLLLSGNVAPLHAQQRAGAQLRSSTARLPSRKNTERGARPQSAHQRLIKVGVRAGDTLASLAERFNITVEEVSRLNNLNAGAQLRPGQQIKVPRLTSEASIEVAHEAPVEQPFIGKRLHLVDGTAFEVDDVWEDSQGIWFRRGGVTNLIERTRVRQIERGKDAAEKTAAIVNQSKVKIVEVNSGRAESAPQPVWIYLVGGARVEADEVSETTDGAWYRRGSLSIFLARARIERIERESDRVAAAAAAGAEQKRSWTERGWSTGNARIDALIRHNGARYGVDPYLIFCVMEQESHFNARVVSPMGARGLMQLMPGTGARFGVRRPFDPAENIMGGTRYLRMLLDHFKGRVDLVLAGYNAGEGAVMKYGGRVPPYKETRNYVKRISARYGKSRSVATQHAPGPVTTTTAPRAGGKVVNTAAASGLK